MSTAQKNHTKPNATMFYLLMMLIIAGNMLVAQTDDWSTPALVEFGVVFDCAVLIPLLYLWFFRKAEKINWIKPLALACLGVWVAGHVVPDTHHQLINQLTYLRYLGLAVLVLIEIRIMSRIYRHVFSTPDKHIDTKQMIQDASKEQPMPEWVARIIAWEAKLYRTIWLKIKHFINRK